jgi:hypothetical protein
LGFSCFSQFRPYIGFWPSFFVGLICSILPLVLGFVFFLYIGSSAIPLANARGSENFGSF